MSDGGVILPPGSCLAVTRDDDGNVISMEPIDSTVEFDGGRYIVREWPP